jgi:hypothetical protein
MFLEITTIAERQHVTDYLSIPDFADYASINAFILQTLQKKNQIS